MIEFLVVVQSLATQKLRVERLHANDLDTAAREAVETFGGRGIVRAVIEYEDGRTGDWMAALRSELA